jgi:DNA-binding MarR family transcriptional regulator
VDAFVALLHAHALTTRELSGQLVDDHGLTISDYEVLLRLARAPERRMRRVDLAARVFLTPSGITRLLDGLERCGYVSRLACPSDRRVIWAVLTDEGLAKVTEASESHFAQIDELFGARLDESQLEKLTELLSLVGPGEAEPCR